MCVEHSANNSTLRRPEREPRRDAARQRTVESRSPAFSGSASFGTYVRASCNTSEPVHLSLCLLSLDWLHLLITAVRFALFVRTTNQTQRQQKRLVKPHVNAQRNLDRVVRGKQAAPNNPRNHFVGCSDVCVHVLSHPLPPCTNVHY